MLKKGTKSKDSANEWTRETLQSLHDSGHTDAEIAEMFGTSAAIVSFARKRKQLWEEEAPATEAPPSIPETEPIIEASDSGDTVEPQQQEAPPRNKGGRPRKIQETENSQNEVE